EQAFSLHYQAAVVNLRTLFQATAQADFKAEELRHSMQRVLSSLNYKLLTGIRLHDQSEVYRQQWQQLFHSAQQLERSALLEFLGDRKSTRLNSSHVKISYAVFSFTKKN